MKKLLPALLLLIIQARAQDSLDLEKTTGDFVIHYKEQDKAVVAEIETYLLQGRKAVNRFFGKKFLHSVNVFIFPDRGSLDRQWQKTWAGQGFRSECWMVASGVGDRLDMISPLTWKTDACEHNGADKDEVQKIVVHELVHVFHGQYNPKHDFDGMDDLGWLIEGLATLVSGQLDKAKTEQAKQWLKANPAPEKLKEVWKGTAKYALAGTLVKYIEIKYGKKAITDLLAFTSQEKILEYLKTTEKELLAGWKASVVKS